MKATRDQLVPVPLDAIDAEKGNDFPLFLHLPLNGKFLLIRHPGDALTARKLQAIREGTGTRIFTYRNFAELLGDVNALNGSAAASPVEPPAQESIIAKSASVAPAETGPEAANREVAEITADILKDPELSSEEKAALLSDPSQDVLRVLRQVSDRGPEAKAEGMKRCTQIVDEIINVAAQDSDIYREILALRKSQEDIDHSTIVGTIAVMFGMSLGYHDEKLLADIAVAAIFHDVGLIEVEGDVLSRQESKWSDADRAAYHKHVEASADILANSGLDLHPRVIRMIREHHERYDGSGFPKGLSGALIDDTSQLLVLANIFDRLCAGKETGTAMSPDEAFDWLYEKGRMGRGRMVRPELLERIFQFMLTEHQAAESLQAQAMDQVRSISRREGVGSA